jgi:hypothetical protein
MISASAETHEDGKHVSVISREIGGSAEAVM